MEFVHIMCSISAEFELDEIRVTFAFVLTHSFSHRFRFGDFDQTKLRVEATKALLCWLKKMKGHDLGKDCLASGSAYRAVSSRETLPGPEADHYELSKVQVSPSYTRIGIA